MSDGIDYDALSGQFSPNRLQGNMGNTANGPNCLVLKMDNGETIVVNGDDNKLERIKNVINGINKEYELDFNEPLPKSKPPEKIDSLEALDTEQRLNIEAELLDQ